MPDIAVVCEGQTEREFCRDVVAPAMGVLGISLWGTLGGKPTSRRSGGIKDWHVYREDVVRLAKERDDRHLAVLVDYYRLPDSWPGRTASKRQPLDSRGRFVEEALIADLEAEFPGRFHPCVELHEYESLLFVDPDISALSMAVGGGVENHEYVAEQMQKVKAQFGGMVEAINDDPQTAPSKRLVKIVRGYDKVAWGVMAAKDVPLDTLRAGCPWLDRWLTTLAGLARGN